MRTERRAPRATGSVPSPLAGKVALVTGAGRGLGEATSRVLARERATVVVGDIDAASAGDVARDLRREGGEAEAMHLDVTDGGSARHVVRETVDRFGRIDVLVNNAGTDVTRPFEELPIEDLERVLRVNLHGPVLMSRLAFPLMRDQGGGHIVNVVSTAAKRAWANASAYHASKWGLLGLSHALHVEGRPVGIKVTAVVAGGMRTPFLLDRFPELDPALLQDPANVAETIRFVLMQPKETVVPEVMVIPVRETSWP